MHISLSCLLLFKRWVQHGDVHAGEAPLVMSTCPRRQKFIFLNNVVVISLSFFLTPYRIQKRSFFFWFLIFFFLSTCLLFSFPVFFFSFCFFFFFKAESLKHFLLFLTIQFKKRRGGGEMQTVFFFFWLCLALFSLLWPPCREERDERFVSALPCVFSPSLPPFFFLLFPSFHDVLIRETGVRAVARLHIRCAVFFKFHCMTVKKKKKQQI